MAKENTGNGNLKDAIAHVDSMAAGCDYNRKGEGKAQTSELARMRTRKNEGDTPSKVS